MNSSARARRRFSSVELDAAEWLVRRDAGLSREQEKEFAAWLAAEPARGRAFADLEQTWAVLDNVKQLPCAAREPDPDALAPVRVREMFGRTPIRRPVWRNLALMAAAVVLFASAGWWQWSARAHYSGAAVTEVGGLRKISLPDGSVVLLNTASAIDVQYSSDERTVKLARGEAHFTVAKNPTRPFFVNAGGVRVRAVGTAFNIRLRVKAVEVLVTEGRVSLADESNGDSLLSRRAGHSANEMIVPAGNEPPALGAGELATIALAAGSERTAVVPVTIPRLDMERALAWQDGRLEFAAVPLGEIVAEFNRYNRHRLVVADPRLAALRFGGSFLADGYDTLVHLLETNHGVIAERRGDETVLRLPP